MGLVVIRNLKEWTYLNDYSTPNVTNQEYERRGTSTQKYLSFHDSFGAIPSAKYPTCLYTWLRRKINASLVMMNTEQWPVWNIGETPDTYRSIEAYVATYRVC